MKKNIYPVLFLLLLMAGTFSFGQSTVSTTVYYTGFQACGGCTVCGADYWCFNCTGCYCGNTPACGTKTFTDPVPPGNIVTNIKVNYYTADCAGSSLTATIDGNAVPAVNEGNTGCLCSALPCGVSAASSQSWPCGMPNYVYGGTNTLQLCTGVSVCINKIVLVITYYTPAAINPTITALGPTTFCQGGSVVLDAGAGYSAYTWNTGANTQQITVTTTGTYWVTVTSISGCTTGNASISVTVNPNPTPSISTSGPTNFCSGGSVVLNAGGGYAGYSWTTGANTQTITVTTSGTYGVTVTDANGCKGTTSINVNVTPSPTIASTSFTPAGCSVANGTATVNPSGGTAPYTYLWSNGQNTQTATGLSGGIYSVTVTDANGCTATASVTVPATTAPTATSSSTPAGCSLSNGSATVNPSGGNPAYTYAWSNGDSNQTATGLSAGTYTVTVTDANGCSVQTIVTVNGTAAPTVSTTSTPTGCSVTNGTATATASGGSPAYTYQWFPSGGNSQTATGLSAGTYTVIVTDANNCTAFDIVTISTTSSPTTSSSVVSNVSCNGFSDGSAATNPSGGNPAYTYQWLPSGGNSQTATGLAAGTYTVIVTDANGCTTSDVINITQPPSLLLSTTSQNNVVCYGQSTGSATILATGGNPAYTYSWNTSPTQNSSTATGLAASNYTCTVTDANGCISVITVTILQPPQLTASINAANVKCNGGSNGSATANMNGGTPPFTYVWNTSPVQNTQTANNLSAGTYSVLITDANGCTASHTVTINQPSPVTLNNISCGDSLCAGASTSLSASASGGTPGYTFVWMPGAQTANSINVNPTTSTSYTVSAVDANGCTASSPLSCLVIVVPGTNALVDTTSSGDFNTIYAFTDSGTGTSWNWNFGDGSSNSTLQNPVHTFPGAGTYTVTEITLNKYGCSDTITIVVTVNSGIIIPNVFSPDGDGVNDVWYVANSGMKDFNVEIYDRWGAKVWEASADEIRWDGRSSSGKPLKDGTYFFALRAILKTDALGGYKNYSTKGYVTLLTNNK